jgi:hypothetical protein
MGTSRDSTHAISLYKESKKTNKELITYVLRYCKWSKMMKSTGAQKRFLFVSAETPKNVGEELSVDIAGPLLIKSTRNFFILFVDRLSRYYLVSAKKGAPTSRDVLNEMLKIMKTNKFTTKNVPSDSGPQFTSCEWKSTLHDNGINCKNLSICYPEGDGITERGNITIKTKIRLNTSKKKFLEKLEAAVMSINNLPNSGTQKVPKDAL